MADPIVAATWGLVLVTGLLVIATALPLITDILRRRDERQTLASRTVPDLNILRSRLVGASEQLADPAGLTGDDVGELLDSCAEELEILAPIVTVRDASLAFTNELFVLRHLLTQALIHLEGAGFLDETDVTEVRERDERLRRAQRAYEAATITVRAAEDLLPKKHRSISGEAFWERFSRLTQERESLAAQVIARSERSPRSDLNATD